MGPGPLHVNINKKIIEQELKVNKDLFLFFISSLLTLLLQNHVREKLTKQEKIN